MNDAVKVGIDAMMHLMGIGEFCVILCEDILIRMGLVGGVCGDVLGGHQRCSRYTLQY